MGEPVTCAHFTARGGVEDAAGFDLMVSVVEQRPAVQQLQVEWPGAVLAVQKLQDATKHRIARGLGRQGDIEAAMTEPPL